MKTCLKQETQQDQGLTQFQTMLAFDGFYHVIRPQDWEVLSVRSKDDGKRGSGEERRRTKNKL